MRWFVDVYVLRLLCGVAGWVLGFKTGALLGFEFVGDFLGMGGCCIW